MSKVKLSIGYRNFVMDVDKATQLLTLLEEAELYDSKYRKIEEGGTTHYIYENDIGVVTLEHIPNKLYTMWKLAGKPKE